MNSPLVTIIVPVYKVEKYLSECIDSLISQSYKNIEIILVDDGSPDNCPKICDQYAKIDNRIKVIHKNNGGLSSARNAGMEVANGDYITFCDSDDILDSAMIDILVELAVSTNSDIVGCESIMFDDNKIYPIYHSETSFLRLDSEKYIKMIFYGQIDPSVCNKLFKAKVMQNHRFLLGRTNEDILFLIHVLCDCSNVFQINKSLYKYRITNGSITHTFNENSLDSFKNLNDINHLILNRYQTCEKAFIFYSCKIIKTIATSIIRNKKLHIEPFTQSFNEAKKFLKKYYIYILINKEFDLRFKFAVTIILLFY